MDDLCALEQVYQLRGASPLDCLGAIVTPYVMAEWERLLVSHQDRDFVAYIVRGITSGFRIGVDPSLINGQFQSTNSNMQSARDNAQVIDSYLGTECSLNRVIGPLPMDTPGIPQALCSLWYVIVDSAVHIIRQGGKGAPFLRN